jgi:hypothetical protein
VIILGGTTPLSPVLFDYGIDAICGTKVIDAKAALDCVGRGATFREIKGTKRLTMLKAAADITWSVMRQDDNGNVALIKSGLTKKEALRVVKEYEAKGHKQTYWVAR